MPAGSRVLCPAKNSFQRSGCQKAPGALRRVGYSLGRGVGAFRPPNSYWGKALRGATRCPRGVTCTAPLGNSAHWSGCQMAPRKLSPRSECCGLHTPAPPTKPIAHHSQAHEVFRPPNLRALVLCRPLYAPPLERCEVPWRVLPHSESHGGHYPPPPHHGYSPPVSGPPRAFWSPDLRALFLGRPLYASCPGRPEDPRRFTPHSESRGHHALVLPTKAIAHPSRGP